MNEKTIILVAQPEILCTTGGSISVFKQFCQRLKDTYNILGVFYSKQDPSTETLYEGCKLINLASEKFDRGDFSNSINSFLADKQTNLIIFFFHYLYINANLSECYDSIPRILMFHSRPDFYFSIISNSLEKLEKVYRNTVSQIIFPEFYDLLPSYIKSSEVVCIPNGIKIQEAFSDLSFEKKRFVFLSRVDNCKGIEFLIYSCYFVFKKHPDWSLDIYGQSQPPEYQARLQKLIAFLGLSNNIFFKGVTTDSISTLKGYDFCVFPSFFEGFGIGLAEAMSVGLPCVGLKKCSGVNSIIKSNVNGFLSDNSLEEFSSYVLKLIENKKLRIELGKNAKHDIEIYSESLIDLKWKNLVSNIVNNKIQHSCCRVNDCKTKKIFSITKIKQMAISTDLLYYNLKCTVLSRIFSVKTVKVEKTKLRIVSLFFFKIVLISK